MQIRQILLITSGFLLASCATPLKQSLEAITLGMDKDEVLDNSGNPWITRRIKSQDLWVYRFYQGEQEYHKRLIFENGKVVKASPSIPHPDPREKLHEANTMTEYSKAAKDEQRKYQDGFKKIEHDGE